MTTIPWTWKGKDGSKGRLLYEPGNWGDLLKLLCLEAFLSWNLKRPDTVPVAYLDPFAGSPQYPLGEKARLRFKQAGLRRLECVDKQFIEQDHWPSAAMAVKTINGGETAVFDADPERFQMWEQVEGVKRVEAASGWDVLAAATPGPNSLWLVDPYDFIAEWRERLPVVLKAAGKVTLLLYLYNRSAKSPEAFAEYRSFRNALDDRLAGGIKRLGRIASDAFLPRAHHEILFLPAAQVERDLTFARLLEGLEKATMELNAAQARAAALEG